MAFVELDRQFMPFKNERDWELDYVSFGSDGYWGAKSWSDLLGHTRIVLLAEAGAGKTAELRAANERVNTLGADTSFYITLNAVAMRGLKPALETSDDEARFQQWKTGSADAWFFIDSLDEARLNGKTFQTALSNLEKALSPHLHRARILVSCRVSDWRSMSDKAEFTKYLGGGTVEASDDNLVYDNADDALLEPFFDGSRQNNTRQASEESSNEEGELLIVALAPLSRKQAATLAQANRVVDTDAFLLALHHADAGDLSNRPQDLLDMAAKWNATGTVGTKHEALEWSIKQRLRETNLDLTGRDTLSFDKAYEGAKYLAAQLTFGQKRLLSWPLEAQQGLTTQDTMDPRAVLPDFSGDHVARLLNRAIFDPATFGAVRFHHRSVQELLCARWLLDRMKDGCPLRRVWNLLTEELCGKTRFRPSLRAIAAWLAQLEPRFLRRVMVLEPQLLIEGGDPRLIPVEERNALLERFASLHRGRNDAGISIDINQLGRLASPKLAPTIRRLWQEATKSGEVRDLLLRLIWVGKLDGTGDIALEAVKSKRRDYERSVGARAMIDIATDEQRADLADYLLKNAKSFPLRAMDAAIQVVFPSALDLAGLEQIIRKHPIPKREMVHSGLNYGLGEIAQNSSPEVLESFAHMLARLVREKPWINKSDMRLSKRHLHLMPPVMIASGRLVDLAEGGPVSDNLAKVIRTILKETEYGALNYQGGESRKTLVKALSANRTVNKQFYDLCLEDYSHELDKVWRFSGAFFNEPWTTTAEDFDTFLQALQAEKEPKRARCFLETCFGIACFSDDRATLLKRMAAVIDGKAALQAALEKLINPPPRKVDEWEKKHRAQTQEIKREREREDKRNRQSWIDFRERLRADKDRIRTDAPFGPLYTCEIWLRSEQRHAGRSANDWRGFDQAFDPAVRDAVQDGLVKIWRSCDPGNLYRKGKLTNGADVGRLGVEIDFERDSGFAHKLSASDVATATRLAWTELTEIPAWAIHVWETKPDLAERPVREEIRWELDRKAGDPRTIHVLNKLLRVPEPFKSRIAVWVLAELKAKEPTNTEALETCLGLVTSAKADVKSELSSLTACKFGKLRRRRNRIIWLSILLSIDAEAGLDSLETWLKAQSTNTKADQLMVDLLAILFPHRGPGYGPDCQDYRALPYIKRLLIIVYRHVRRADDIKHDGVYKPDARDRAQDARNAILNMLLNIPGSETVGALLDLAERPEFEISRERFLVLADQRATRDADLKPWASSDLLAFADSFAPNPTRLADLHTLVMDRLVDIKDEMESGTFSNRDLLRQDHRSRAKERPVQLAIAQQLDLRRGTSYSNVREPEQEDYNEPDILISNPNVPAPLPVEIKVSGSWTYGELVEALRTQLMGKYMKSNAATHGILLVTYHGKKRHWVHSDNGPRLTFAGLVDALRSEASALTASHLHVERVDVVGISLNP